MTNWGILIPVAAVVMGPLAWMFTTWIRARHGYPLEGSKGEPVERESGALRAENDALKGQVGRLEERIGVLERIATDPAAHVAREIEQLR
jgi:hypothetical protein